MLKALRIVAIAEGISWLLLLITMVMKYGFEIVGPNKLTGNIHGALFIAFVILVLLCVNKFKWKGTQTVILLLSSIIPFGTFWAEKKYLR